MLTDVARVWVPKTVAGGVFVALNFWLASLLGPAEYGVLAFCISLVLLIDSIVGGSVDLGLLRYAGGSSDSALTSGYELAALVLKATAVVAAVAVAVLAGGRFGRFLFGSSQGSVLFTLAALAGAALLVLRSAQTRFQLRSQYARYGLSDWLHSLLRVGFIAGIIYSGMANPTTVLACYAVAAATTALVVAPQLLRLRSMSRTQVVSLWRFARAAGATFAVGAVVARLDIFALAIASTPAQLGLFSLAMTLAAVPEMLGSYLAPVFTARITTWHHSGQLASLFGRIQLALIAVAGAGLLAGWVAARPLAAAVFPSGYDGAGQLLQILLVGGMAAFITFPVTLHFVMIAKPHAFIVMDGVTAPLLIVAYLYAARRHGALGVAYVTAGSRLLKATFMQWLAVWLTRRPGLTLPFEHAVLLEQPVVRIPVEASVSR